MSNGIYCYVGVDILSWQLGFIIMITWIYRYINMNLMLWQCEFIILIMPIYDYLKPSLPRFIQPRVFNKSSVIP